MPPSTSTQEAAGSPGDSLEAFKARQRAKLAARPTESHDPATDEFAIARPGDTRCPVCSGPMRSERVVCTNVCYRRARTSGGLTVDGVEVITAATTALTDTGC